ncbi:MAG TPA: hypothetical protein VKB93_03450 [Thermoanaerobaculia bacterium]|nr:hypothetical protein [Thermoanaerobaculia bacterium]
MIRLIAVLWLFCAALAHAESVPFDADHWTIDGKESRFEDYRGRRALFLKDARATLKDMTMRDGVIEFDMAFPLERGFSGVQFRMADGQNYEEFYLRQHLSGMPDANQYSPVFYEISGWQIYTGARYCTPVTYTDNDWMHVRLAIAGSRGEAEIAGNVVPIAELKRDPIDGTVALYARIAGARFANFEMRPGPVALRTAEGKPEERPRDVVEAWDVSDPFDEKLLDGNLEFMRALHWTRLQTERNGIANLARLTGTSPAANTVIARLQFQSDKATTRKVRFGFSDRVRVYLNGKLLYAGDDGYLSRDYRFLGSVGLFDTLPLLLRKGHNELLFAVSESFGGWAVIAQFVDP